MLWRAVTSLAFILALAGSSTIIGFSPPVLTITRSAPPMAARTVVRPLAFEANAGQTDPNVRFMARAAEYSLFLTASEAVIVRGGDVARLRFPGGNARAAIVPIDPMPGVTNYIIGSDPSRWRTGIVSYAKVRYEQIYPGIDLVFYGNQQQLEYDLVVHAGANPDLVRLEIHGARDVTVASDGDLIGRMGRGEIRVKRPLIYQATDAGGKRLIDGRYRKMRGHTFGLAIDAYDRSKALVIDPVVVYSTYLGGSGRENALSCCGNREKIAVDATGAAYITGYTESADFPLTNSGTGTGPLGTAFITKIAADGASLVYSTYVNGTAGGCCGSSSVGEGIAVDALGNAYVTGTTSTTDFPATQSFAPFRGLGNMFLLKLDPAGSSLVYSIVFGVADQDEATGVDIDAAGNAYVVGSTTNDGSIGPFPVTPGAFQTVCGCNRSIFAPRYDAFVLKFNAAGTAIVYGTFLGGSASDRGTGIAINSAGEAHVTGRTGSGDFPTAIPEQGANAGLNDAFVSKLNAAGSGLVFSTYLGGTSNENQANPILGAIAVDPAGNAYVSGYTDSGDFPTTPGAFQAIAPGGPGFRAYGAKYTPLGQFVYSTFLSGDGGSFGTSVAADALGRGYFAGLTGSTFPTTADATQSVPGGSSDAYITVLDSLGTTAEFSTYLGGASFDFANGLALGPGGSIYVGGQSEFGNAPASPGPFPTTENAFDRDYHGGGSDLFVARIDFAPPDGDDDGVIDDEDNCPLVANPDQTDTDADGQGDACDADDDNDGVLDDADNCPLSANPDQVDSDGDGQGNVCDADDDNDGVPDANDNCPVTSNPDQRDIDNDGQGDACEAFAFPAGGVFVIGDLTPHTSGTTVNYWGSQWAQNNSLSGGPAPNSFKGFENSNPVSSCGGTWTTSPGNSSGPPATVPPYMAVIVSSGITKSGSTISGDIKEIVIVYTRPGYGPSPGHRGDGTVVATLCGSPSSE